MPTLALARMPVMAAVRPGRSGPVMLIRTISFKAPLQSENKVRYSTRKCPAHHSCSLLPAASTGYTCGSGCHFNPQFIDRDHFESHSEFIRQSFAAWPRIVAQQAPEATRGADAVGARPTPADVCAASLVQPGPAAARYRYTGGSDRQ